MVTDAALLLELIASEAELLSDRWDAMPGDGPSRIAPKVFAALRAVLDLQPAAHCSVTGDVADERCAREGCMVRTLDPDDVRAAIAEYLL